jgi:hypothetical protein
VHLLENQCDRCWAEFPSRDEFEDHDAAISLPTACTLNLSGHVEGMSERQYSKIIKRRNSRGAGAEIEKWQAIYNILFPSEPIPLPCKSHMDSDLTQCR